MATDSKKLSPIYDAIDSGSYKVAIQACNKILKKQPKSLIVKILKSLSLLRTQKIDEAIALCDEVLEARPTDENILIVLAQVLRPLERHQDIIVAYEAAFKADPHNEELGSQAFMAMIRIGSWKTAQQISLKLSRTFSHDPRYLGWSAMCAILQASDPITEEKMRPVLLSLAVRLFQQLPKHAAEASSPDKMCLLLEAYLSYSEPKLEEAFQLLTSDVGKQMSDTSLAVDELRRLVFAKAHKYTEERAISKDRLSKGDRNWLSFQSYLDSTFASLDPDASKAAIAVSESVEFLHTLSATDNRKDRGSLLVLHELEHRIRSLSPEISQRVEGRKSLGQLLELYFTQFGQKACCYEDLLPYIADDVIGKVPGEKDTWVDYLKQRSSDITSMPALAITINALKLLRRMKADSAKSEEQRGASLFQKYLVATRSSWCRHDDDELNPADGLALLSANSFIQAWADSGKKASDALHQAILVLEYASSQSVHNYQLRILLIRLYRSIGALSLARQHYKKLNVRTLQHETLSHFILERGTALSTVNDGDLAMIQEALEASTIYQENTNETPEMLTKAFLYEKYSQIQNFIEFEDRLDRSLQRDLIKIDHVRMRFVVEPPTQETLAIEIGDLDYMYLSEKVHHDNRDYTVLPNLQPSGSSIEEQTKIGPRPGIKWCDLFVQIYIRILNRAAESDFYSPYLFQFSEEDLAELTPAESVFVKYAEILSEWLWPSDKPRPTPEKADPNSKYNPNAIVTLNGNGEVTVTAKPETSNGHAPHPPYITLAETERTAGGAVACIGELLSLLKAALTKADVSWEALHIASLMQEALVALNIQSMSLGPQTVNGKPKKADPHWVSVKTVRTKLSSLLHDASKLLVAFGDSAESEEAKSKLVKSCAPLITEDTELASFSTSHFTTLTQAQKSLFTAMGNGIANIADGKRPTLPSLA